MKRIKWLNDEDINGGMFLINQQFQEIGGLNECSLKCTLGVAMFPKALEELGLPIIYRRD